jgi:putative hydrolase of the HAD superfamily
MMPEVNRLMTDWMARALSLTTQQATALRQRYWHRYGATLLGLVRHHGVDPHVFLRETHPMDSLEHHVQVVRGLRARIQKLEGRRWLLTNAPRAYAHRLIRYLGLRGCFDRVIAIEDMRAMGQLRPKPSAWLWGHLRRQAGLPAHRVHLVDDSTENLRAAHRAGLRTARIWCSHTQRKQAWVQGRPLGARRPSFVRLQVNSLADLASRGRSK